MLGLTKVAMALLPTLYPSKPGSRLAVAADEKGSGTVGRQQL